MRDERKKMAAVFTDLLTQKSTHLSMLTVKYIRENEWKQTTEKMRLGYAALRFS